MKKIAIILMILATTFSACHKDEEVITPQQDKVSQIKDGVWKTINYEVYDTGVLISTLYETETVKTYFFDTQVIVKNKYGTFLYDCWYEGQDIIHITYNDNGTIKQDIIKYEINGDFLSTETYISYEYITPGWIVTNKTNMEKI